MSIRLEQSLRKAVEAGDLMLMFQPQVTLHTFEVADRRTQSVSSWISPVFSAM